MLVKTKLASLLVVSLVLASFPCQPAHAYIGPGIGAGVVATILGVISSVFLALVAIIYYPIKRIVKRRKQKTASKADASSAVIENPEKP